MFFVLAPVVLHVTPRARHLDPLTRAIARLLLLTAALAAPRLLAALAALTATRSLATTTALVLAVLIVVGHVYVSCVSPNPLTNTVAISWFH
jgi:hypothetical protein